ncbi:MAG: hypothetical protein MJE68_11760 [Proteobacteria bacterium]|nr:hypothetical protein [Pseudomonadota bacterium]
MYVFFFLFMDRKKSALPATGGTRTGSHDSGSKAEAFNHSATSLSWSLSLSLTYTAAMYESNSVVIGM